MHCVTKALQLGFLWESLSLRWSSLKFPHSFLFLFLFHNFPLPATQYYGRKTIKCQKSDVSESTVVAKNTATWCSELGAGPIVSDQREDTKFEWFEDFWDTYPVTIYGNSTDTNFSIIEFCTLFLRLHQNQKPFIWYEITCKGDCYHIWVHLNCLWFELAM